MECLRKQGYYIADYSLNKLRKIMQALVYEMECRFTNNGVYDYLSKIVALKSVLPIVNQAFEF